MGHFRTVCRSKRSHAVHEVEIEVGPDSQGEDIEIVSINSLYLNRRMVTNNGKLGKCRQVKQH